MRKWITGVLLFDLMAGMIFLGMYGLKGREVAADSGLVQIVGEEVLSEEVKKIAITFDGDVIIGLSQGIGVVRDDEDRTESMSHEVISNKQAVIYCDEPAYWFMYADSKRAFAFYHSGVSIDKYYKSSKRKKR